MEQMRPITLLCNDEWTTGPADLTIIECVIIQHLIDNFGFISYGMVKVMSPTRRTIILDRDGGYAKIFDWGQKLVVFDSCGTERKSFDASDPEFFTLLEDIS